MPHTVKHEIISGTLDILLLRYYDKYTVYQCYVFICKIILQFVRQGKETSKRTQMF